MKGRFRYVSRTYRGQKTVWEFSAELYHALEEGRITGLIGKNGAGKSTAFKAILGLIHVDDGQSGLWDSTVPDLRLHRKEEIGVVLSDSTFSGYLTKKQISYIMEKMYHRFDREDFLEKCRKLSIPLNKSLKEFSTGMRAKLKVLLALSHEAKIIWIDLELPVGPDSDLLVGIWSKEGREESLISSPHISSDLEGPL